MVSTNDIMNRISNKKGIQKGPSSRFKPLSTQRGLSEMFKPRIVDSNEVETKLVREEKTKDESKIETKNDVELRIEDYERKIAELEKALLNQKLKNNSNKVNEEKVLNAIRMEKIEQDCEKPVITRSMFLKKYKINIRYFDESVNNLITKGLINRGEVKYSTKVTTYNWELN